MKREFLKKLGITDKTVIGEIMKENGDDINAAKGKGSAELEAEIDLLKNQLADKDKVIEERDTQIEEIKNSAGDNQKLKDEITRVQNENVEAMKQNDTVHRKEMNDLKITTAAQIGLIGADCKNVKAAMPFVNLEGAELDEDGKIKDFDEQIKTLKAGDDTKFLFKEEQKTTFKGFVPGEGKDELPGNTKASSLEEAIQNHYNKHKGD